MSLPCPRCRTPLVAETIELVPVDRCLRCDGVWLDEGELERIDAAGPPPEPIEGGADLPPAPEPMEWELPCPKCERTMHRLEYGGASGVIVDKCEGHGIWFDFEELDRLRRHLRSGRPAEQGSVWTSLKRLFGGRA